MKKLRALFFKTDEHGDQKEGSDGGQDGKADGGQDGKAGGGQDGKADGALRLENGETLPVDDMSVEEIGEFLRGRVFQAGSAWMAAGYGAILCFPEVGNEYYWFCSSMDRQSRVRAEHGTWEMEEGFMTFTTDKLVEWQGGNFSCPTGSTGSRFELNDFYIVVSPVDIESSFNFRMFKFGHPEPTDIQLGFICGSFGALYNLSYMGIDVLEKDYEENFALFHR